MGRKLLCCALTWLVWASCIGGDRAPVTVRDVATVQVSNLPRLGIAGQNLDDDIVEGIVLMRRGAETMPTLMGVLAEVDKINSSDALPPGVRIADAKREPAR